MEGRLILGVIITASDDAVGIVEMATKNKFG